MDSGLEFAVLRCRASIPRMEYFDVRVMGLEFRT
jgi:hypothetical protein